MNLVLLNLFHSNYLYSEDRWVTESTYQLIKKHIPKKILLSFFDDECEVITDTHYTENELRKCKFNLLSTHYNKLKLMLIDICKKYNLDYEKEEKEIADYISSLDKIVKITVEINESESQQFMQLLNQTGVSYTIMKY